MEAADVEHGVERTDELLQVGHIGDGEVGTLVVVRDTLAGFGDRDRGEADAPRWPCTLSRAPDLVDMTAPCWLALTAEVAPPYAQPEPSHPTDRSLLS